MNSNPAPVPEPEPGAPLLVSLAEASRLLGIGQTTVRRLAAAGTIDSVRIGNRRLYPLAGLEAYVATLRAKRSPRRAWRS